MLLVLSLCLLAVFVPGAPFQVSRGIPYLLAGVLMIAIPTRNLLPKSYYVLAAGFAVLSSLCFLPSGWFAPQAWREALRGEGLDSGTLVTAHPEQALEMLGDQLIALIVALFILSQRVSSRAATLLALLFPLGVAGYSLVSIGAAEQQWQLAWDLEPGFGFFPNRNHTATLLAMGTVTAGASLFLAAKFRRGGTAGLAALALVVCLWALAGYNLSRAGFLLTAVGVVAWLAALGREWISRRVLIVFAVCLAVGGGLFWLADTGIKARLTASAAAPAAPAARSGADDIPRTVTAEGESFDFRELIYRDTITMIASEPWVGTGPGMFRFVFPQYRHHSAASNNSQVVHPESDWLMVAAESGVLAALVLAAGVILVFATAFRGARKRSSWPLLLGCLTAAAMVPFHGLFDVPAHRMGLCWSAAFLLALALRDSGGSPYHPRLLLWTWRLAGAVILLAGCGLLRSEWLTGQPTPVVAPDHLTAQARHLYALDQTEKPQQEAQDKTAENAPPQAEGPDRVLQAIDLVDQAIAIAPLDQQLHYTRGAFVLNFSDHDAEADRSFLIQRILDPTWVRLPVRQARNWLGIDPARAAALWANAMDRSEHLEQIAPITFLNRSQVFHEILDQAAQYSGLGILTAQLIRGNSERALTWARRTDSASLESVLPTLMSGELATIRGELFDIWASRDAKASDKWRQFISN